MTQHTRTNESIEDLRDRSVSTGTHDSDTLITRFLGVLKTYAKDKYNKYVKENPEVLDTDGMDDETKGWVVDELFDLLGEIAPEGTYFGANEGAGADFGFWSVADEKRTHKKNDKSRKKVEGPGAGYTVTIKGLEIVGKPEIDYSRKKNSVYDQSTGGVKDAGAGVYTIVAPVEYDADAEGYDWSVSGIIGGVMDMDRETYKGTLTMEVADTPDIWDAMRGSFFDDPENPTDEEKRFVLMDCFGKGTSFNDFEDVFGRGWSHCTFEGSYDVCIQSDYYGFDNSGMEFGGPFDGYANGTLTIDPAFSSDVEYACDYGDNLYQLIDAVKEYLAGKGVDVSTLDGKLRKRLQYSVPANSEEIDDAFVKDAVFELVDCGMEFEDEDGNTVVVESHGKNEADYSRVSSPVRGAYKVLDDYFIEDGKLSDYLESNFNLTFENDDQLYNRSKSKAVKSHSLAWDTILKVANQLLEWDDDTKHATRLSSEQLKNWFKHNGMDYKEAMKPFVAAVDDQRKEWWDGVSESKQSKELVAMRKFTTPDGVETFATLTWNPTGTYSGHLCDMLKTATVGVRDTDAATVSELVYKRLGKKGTFNLRLEPIGKRRTAADVGYAARALATELANREMVGESKQNEGWDFGWSSKEDMLRDNQLDENKWALEKTYGTWYCYVNKETGRPLVVYYKTAKDGNTWGVKAISSDMGPSESNIQAAKWLKPRLEQWEQENGKADGYDWDWIERSLGKEAANKSHKDLIKSLVPGDNVQLIPEVANGAVVEYVRTISPSKIIVSHNGREMGCKPSYIASKVGGADESKQCEKITQKDLKDMVKAGAAVDITNVSDDEAKDFRSKGLEKVSVSTGIYGMNGALFQDKDGKNYVITARNSNLFYFV